MVLIFHVVTYVGPKHLDFGLLVLLLELLANVDLGLFWMELVYLFCLGYYCWTWTMSRES